MIHEHRSYYTSKSSANRQTGHSHTFWSVREFNNMSIGHFVTVDHFVTALSRVERNRILGSYLGGTGDMWFKGQSRSLELLQKKS